MRAIEKANPRLDGIFGDAPWTNKERLPDRLLSGLVEHFSRHTLGLSNVAQDDLGDAYEYLIKQFADDSGHTAAEFYTNRTVVHLMTRIVDPQPGEIGLRPDVRNGRAAAQRACSTCAQRATSGGRSASMGRRSTCSRARSRA